MPFISSTELPLGPTALEKADAKPNAPTHDDQIRQKAQEFEAVFIGQMLKFSGLDKALTVSGGDDASAFTGFYIDKFAEKISEAGGFGLAEKIYAQMARINQQNQEIQNQTNQGVVHVNPDKL